MDIHNLTAKQKLVIHEVGSGRTCYLKDIAILAERNYDTVCKAYRLLEEATFEEIIVERYYDIFYAGNFLGYSTKVELDPVAGISHETEVFRRSVKVRLLKSNGHEVLKSDNGYISKYSHGIGVITLMVEDKGGKVGLGYYDIEITFKGKPDNVTVVLPMFNMSRKSRNSRIEFEAKIDSLDNPSLSALREFLS